MTRRISLIAAAVLLALLVLVSLVVAQRLDRNRRMKALESAFSAYVEAVGDEDGQADGAEVWAAIGPDTRRWLEEMRLAALSMPADQVQRLPFLDMHTVLSLRERLSASTLASLTAETLCAQEPQLCSYGADDIEFELVGFEPGAFAITSAWLPSTSRGPDSRIYLGEAQHFTWTEDDWKFEPVHILRRVMSHGDGLPAQEIQRILEETWPESHGRPFDPVLWSRPRR